MFGFHVPSNHVSVTLMAQLNITGQVLILCFKLRLLQEPVHCSLQNSEQAEHSSIFSSASSRCSF